MSDIKELQNNIKELVAHINKTHNHDKPELISFMKASEEMGEIAQVLLSSQIKSRKNDQLSKEEVKEELGCEVADCIIALISLANDFDVDLKEVLDKKMKKHIDRNVTGKKD
jgi:NTP pyrophosphatase (non-canonical NTP hydrolase)